MNLVSTGIGKVVAEFVEKRLIQLHRMDMNLFIIQNYGEARIERVPGIKHIKFHSFRKAKFLESIIHLTLSLWRLLFNLRSYIKLYKLSPSSNPLRRIIWSLERINIIDAEADIIHLQWLGMVSSMKWLGHWFNVPIIASARGSQVTIYPHLNPNALDYIRDCINSADLIHCVSKSIQNKVFQLHPDYPRNRVVVNYNGISTDKYFYKSKIRDQNSKIVLLSVGNFMWRKNFISQFELVLYIIRGGFTNFILRIIGGGNDFNNLKSIVNLLGLNSYIEIFEYIDQDKIVDEYHKADIYLSTSLAEGLSNSVMEAAACGLPCVVFESEGMEELIIHGQTGFIVKVFDMNSFGNCTLSLMRDNFLREKVGKASAQKMKVEFEASKHTIEMFNIYKNLIESIE